MRGSLKKIGNSAGIVIPKPLLSEFGAQTGDSLELKLENGRIVIERIVRAPRAGWAEDAKRLAETGDDELVWPYFGNEGDEDLQW